MDKLPLVAVVLAGLLVFGPLFCCILFFAWALHPIVAIMIVAFAAFLIFALSQD